jgi:hypothetical protein
LNSTLPEVQHTPRITSHGYEEEKGTEEESEVTDKGAGLVWGRAVSFDFREVLSGTSQSGRTKVRPLSFCADV